MQQPAVMRGNQLIWWTFNQIGVSLWDGLGGINGQAIESGLRMIGVPEGDQGSVYRKLLILAHGMRRNNGQQ